jgi:hypothetical protein
MKEIRFHTPILQPINILRWNQRLDIPYHLCILVDTPVTREESHSSNTGDALGNPLFLVLVCLINQVLSLAVAVEVVRDEIVVAVLDDTIDES